MAILRGFPPSNTISPSVRITEKDLSLITAEQSLHRAGLIGFASKGPINLPVMISTARQLATVFGNPHPDVGDPYLIYAAQQYLLVANELFVVRVGDDDPVSDEQALTATVDVLSAGTVAEIVSATDGPYDFDPNPYVDATITVDAYFVRFKLNGQLSPKTLIVESSETAKDSVEVVEELNAQLDTALDGIEFFVDGDADNDPIGVRTTWAYGPSASIELVSVQNAIYGPTGIGGNITGLATGMTQAVVTGTATKYPSGGSVGEYTLPNTSDWTLELVLDGTDNVTIDGVVQTIDLNTALTLDGTPIVAIADIVDAVNALRYEEGGELPGGWEASASGNSLVLKTVATGADSRIRVKVSSTAETVFGLPTTTKSGVTTEGAADAGSTASYGLVTGADNTTGEVTFTLTADSAGVDGNQTQVVITNDIRENHFSLAVYNNGVQVESWGSITKDSTSSYYIETYLSLASDYVRAINNDSVAAGPASATYDLGDTQLGSDGIPSDPDKQDELLIGSPVGSTGLYVLSEPEQIDIDLIAVPGHSSTSVVTAMLDFCQNYRQDCLAIVDAPFGLTVKEIIAWQNGAHPLNLIRFDSDFGALYWPWVKIRDNFNRVDVWVPPSGSVMAVIARSDFLSKPWFAPAGLNRGIVPGILDVYDRPTLAERDLMYGNRNCINPIVSFTDVDGFLVWGQKTLQRRPTALDRVNVRRLMFYLEKRIRSAVRTLLFDPNDDVFQRRFTSICAGILEEAKKGRGLNDYFIKADAELNTPDVIDRNEFRAQIGVQPTRAVEFMFIEFSIHRTGSFTETADSTF